MEKMLRQGVIQPSKCPWASPVVLVAKKDGSTWFCIDYRTFNVYLLPKIDDTLDVLAHKQYFSTLNLASRYWQVQMNDTSRRKLLCNACGPSLIF